MNGTTEDLHSLMSHGPSPGLGEPTRPDQDGERQLGYNPRLSNQGNYDPDLHHDRRQTQHKLKRRFENIFAKYERDFDGIGDEVDLQTGEIVVNNGHIAAMRHEGDTGARGLQRELPKSRNDEAGRDGDSQSLSVQGRHLGHHVGISRGRAEMGGFGDTLSTDVLDQSLGEDPLTYDGDPTMNPSHISTARVSERTRAIVPYRNAQSFASGPDFLDEIPALQQSMQTLQQRPISGPSVHPDAITALGLNIAKQLTEFMAQNFRHTNVDRIAEETQASGAWSYPPLPEDQISERRLPQSSGRPVRRLPALLSPTRESLWAPLKLPPQVRTRRPIQQPGDEFSDEAEASAVVSGLTPSVHPAPTTPQRRPRTSRNEPRSCSNCGRTGDATWRLDDEGQDLCNACGVYLYKYGVLRPTESLLNDDKHDEVADLELHVRENTQHQANVGVPRKRFTPFSTAEDSLLITLKELEGFHWDEIATYFPGRSPYAVQCRYSKKLHGRDSEARNSLMNRGYTFEKAENGDYIVPAPKGVFSDEEDDLLLKLRDEDGLNWEEIAIRLGSRGPVGVERRFKELVQRCLERQHDDPFHVSPHRRTKPDRVRSRTGKIYTAEEDVRLLRLREEEKKRWEEIAEYFPGRHPGSLQKHYKRDLRPGSGRSPGRRTLGDSGQRTIDDSPLQFNTNELRNTSVARREPPEAQLETEAGDNFPLDPELSEYTVGNGLSPVQNASDQELVTRDANVAGETRPEGVHPDAMRLTPGILHRLDELLRPEEAVHNWSADTAIAEPATQPVQAVSSTPVQSAPKRLKHAVVVPVRRSNATDLSSTAVPGEIEEFDAVPQSLGSLLTAALRSNNKTPMTILAINKWIEEWSGFEQDRSTAIRRELRLGPEFEKVGRTRPFLWRLAGSDQCSPDEEHTNEVDEIIVTVSEPGKQSRARSSRKRTFENIASSLEQLSKRRKVQTRSSLNGSKHTPQYNHELSLEVQDATAEEPGDTFEIDQGDHPLLAPPQRFNDWSPDLTHVVETNPLSSGENDHSMALEKPHESASVPVKRSVRIRQRNTETSSAQPRLYTVLSGVDAPKEPPPPSASGPWCGLRSRTVRTPPDAEGGEGSLADNKRAAGTIVDINSPGSDDVSTPSPVAAVAPRAVDGTHTPIARAASPDQRIATHHTTSNLKTRSAEGPKRDVAGSLLRNIVIPHTATPKFRKPGSSDALSEFRRRYIRESSVKIEGKRYWRLSTPRTASKPARFTMRRVGHDSDDEMLQ